MSAERPRQVSLDLAPRRTLLDWLIAERVVMAIILLNTLALTLGGFHAEGSAEWRFYHRIDYACVVFFVVEAILKIRKFGWHGYRASGWNRFDFLVTVLCLPVLIEPLTSRAVYLDWLPVFRAGRLFRLFRLLRFIPDATGLAQGVARALKASVGVFLALALVNLIFALTASFLFGSIAPEHFGDPARSLYTLFQIFTLEGWDQYPALIAERTGDPFWSFGARAFFMAAVLVGGLLGLSLANAVFIDEMTLDNTRVLEDKVDALSAELRQLRRAIEAQERPMLESHREEPES